MEQPILINASCGTKCYLRNGDEAFVVGSIPGSFSSSFRYVIAYKGQLFEYFPDGRMMYPTAEPLSERLGFRKFEYPSDYRYGDFDIVSVGCEPINK